MATLVYDNCAARGDWGAGKWYRHKVPDGDLWDPAAQVTCDGALVIEARPFTLTRRDPHDNVKALVYSTADFSPRRRRIVDRRGGYARRRFRHGRQSSRCGCRDVRLGCGAFNTIDLQTSMVFDFFVSNGRIVALYERLPFTLRPDNRYPLFTELIPVDVPTAPDQGHRYAITYDQAHDRVAWLVDGAVVAERAFVGAPPGERGPIVKIKSLKIGGGLFTLFGDLNSDRVRTGDGKKIPGLDPGYERTLFGQGARVEFGRFEIATE